MSSRQSLELDQASKTSENENSQVDIEELLEGTGYALQDSRSIYELSALRDEDYSQIYIRDLEEIFDEPEHRYEIGRYKNRFMPGQSFRVDDLANAYQILIEEILNFEIEGELQELQRL